jgi:hypothetical protein
MRADRRQYIIEDTDLMWSDYTEDWNAEEPFPVEEAHWVTAKMSSIRAVMVRLEGQKTWKVYMCDVDMEDCHWVFGGEDMTHEAAEEWCHECVDHGLNEYVYNNYDRQGYYTRGYEP